MKEEMINEMQKHGYHLTGTGGNCTAFANDDETILITKRSDPEAPEFLTEPITVGFYSIATGSPEFEVSQDFPSLIDYLK